MIKEFKIMRMDYEMHHITVMPKVFSNGWMWCRRTESGKPWWNYTSLLNLEISPSLITSSQSPLLIIPHFPVLKLLKKLSPWTFYLVRSLPRWSWLASIILNIIYMLTNPKFITLAEMSPLNSRLIYPSSYSAQFIWMSTMHLKTNISKMILVILTL